MSPHDTERGFWSSLHTICSRYCDFSLWTYTHTADSIGGWITSYRSSSQRGRDLWVRPCCTSHSCRWSGNRIHWTVDEILWLMRRQSNFSCSSRLAQESIRHSEEAELWTAPLQRQRWSMHIHLQLSEAASSRQGHSHQIHALLNAAASSSLWMWLFYSSRHSMCCLCECKVKRRQILVWSCCFITNGLKSHEWKSSGLKQESLPKILSLESVASDFL